ncbi:2-amino-4-hydroxy-6-hydroxymethyldihydropteridine diphosphokinase [Micrococcus sp.]|uniref:2-amino-4-hydroxy-6- hydroxymethyldihydropteridine diphosphokinase n=1 Tax=Micrococcus sp. TaxID=1271 RepID=UPI002A913192|nr:2-amino-4-hydroxy-6-hydroxymethyldihydropteridine diphosphokinase [Micrococcus sp.]MDY6054653.1 2-amino-4-hydroxy-6-hydroxymethyldihydropteridine diphosphokinase [Micrococcus sp.]
MSAPTPELAARPEAPVAAVLALGANLGDVSETLDAAVAALTVTPGVLEVRPSPRAITAPVGGPPGQREYLNQVLRVRTTLSAWELLELAQRLEQDHHRRRTVRWGPRTLDVDLIVYGDLTSDHPDLTLPHPRAAERAFVLLPWLWLEPEAELGGVPVAELARCAEDAPGVRREPPRRAHLDGPGRDVAGPDVVRPGRAGGAV